MNVYDIRWMYIYDIRYNIYILGMKLGMKIKRLKQRAYARYGRIWKINILNIMRWK